jgi:hydroxylamine reductase (hybrid-cluster protein)
MAKNYTPKQIEKYKRQKYISALNKCTKNLFKLFRDKSTTYENFKSRFKALKDELDKLEEIRLNSQHSKKSKEYIQNLYNATINNQNFTQNDFLEIKDSELTKLNRLQKLKNKTKYSKEKHKDRYLDN